MILTKFTNFYEFKLTTGLLTSIVMHNP